MAAFLLASVWCALLFAAALAPALGASRAVLAAYVACALLLVATRPRGGARTPPLAAACAGAAGFAALPAWLAVVWAVGVCLGLAPPRMTATAAGGASGWLAHVALAPLFEELLYRERLLPALRARVGAPLALLLASALFAAPHLEPWSVLATFCVGLALGAVFFATESVALCIAYHAGANAAVLVCGLPPGRAALAPSSAALVSGLLLALACAWTRGRARRPCVHAAASAKGTAARGGARRLQRRAACCHRSASGS
jgi:membrane protease YdiL (CAAX protease family)